MSAGGAVGLGADGSPPQPVRVGFEGSQQVSAPTMPVLTTVDGDYVPPGVDVGKPVSTAVVVNAAKVASYPSRTAASLPLAPLFLSGQPAAQGFMAAAPGFAQLGSLNGMATSIPAGQSTIAGRVTHVPAACEGTGRDGKRVQVLYVAEEGSSRYWEVKESLESFVADVDDVFALSSRKTDSGRRVRWVQDSLCKVQIYPVEVPAYSLGTSADPTGAFLDMKHALMAKGYQVTNQKYLVFADAPALCGIAETVMESQKELNRNDGSAPMYARIDPQCWRSDANGTNPAAHELMHMLGAVQTDAPSALSGHCWDESDVMCYPVPGEVLPQVCPLDQEPLFDCNDNDYFNPAADLDPSNYLATHWNTADSSYLTSAPVLPPSPVVTGPEQIPSGGSALFAAAHPSITSFQWAVQSDAGCIADPLAGPSTMVSCPAGAVAGPVKVIATGTASDGQLAEGLRQSSVSPSSPPPLPTATIEGPSTLTAAAAAYTVSSSNPVASVAWTSSSTACGITNAATSTATVNCTNWNGPLTLTATVTDVYGQVITRMFSVTVTSLVPFTVTASGPASIRPGLTGVVTATGSSFPVVSYSWAGSYAPCLPGVKTGRSVTVQCPSWVSGARTFTLTAKAADGRVAVVSVPVKLGASTTAKATVGLTRTVATVAPGGASTLKATVRYGTIPVRSAVQFYYSSNGSTWSKVGGVLDTGSSGNASLVVKPAGAGVSARYKAVVIGAAGTGWAVFAQPQTTVVVNKYLARASMKGVAGRPDRVSSQLTTSTGIVLKAQRVYLTYRVAGTATWRTVGYRSTSTSGMVSMSVQPKRGTYYRWYYAGSRTVTGVYSKQVYFRY